MSIKVLFDDSGKIFGAQVVGSDGVDKRIDILATAIRSGMTIAELEDLELAYAPPYGAAKDPINFVGFVGNNILRGDSQVAFPDSLPENAFILDVREPEEVAAGAIPGAVNIPLGQVRKRLAEIPKDRTIVATCKVGLRGYVAERILRLNGFDARNLSGGYTTWCHFHPKPSLPPGTGGKGAASCTAVSCAGGAAKKTEVPKTDGPTMDLDACGLQCPGPIVAVKNKLDAMKPGEILRVSATDAGFEQDLPAWCSSTGNEFLDMKRENGKLVARVQKSGPITSNDASGGTPSQGSPGPKRTTLVLFSNDLDKTMAAFIIATGFASLGHEVSIFFTFWGLNVLRKDHPPAVSKDLLSRMFGWMMPCGARKLALSKMHMLGAGTAMMKHVMASKNVENLPSLIKQAQGMGVRFLACEMAMNVMGIQREELLDGIESAGVAGFAALAEKSGTTLFI
jgi:peroxiredoxin family protein/rhodanese-related sulfurtransferase/TusA-related sulfurtransferase